MTERSVKRHPRGIHIVRVAFGSLGAQSLGWSDGLFGKIDRVGHELDKYRQRGETAIGNIVTWWAETDGDLQGEYEVARERLNAAERSEIELLAAVDTATREHEKKGDTYTEFALIEKGRELDFSRRQQMEARERCQRFRAHGLAVFEIAQSRAGQIKDYYESLMRTYLAANRKAPMLDHLPEIKLPDVVLEPPRWLNEHDVTPTRKTGRDATEIAAEGATAPNEPPA